LGAIKSVNGRFFPPFTKKTLAHGKEGDLTNGIAFLFLDEWILRMMIEMPQSRVEKHSPDALSYAILASS
jgi:hypothetical protein